MQQLLQDLNSGETRLVEGPCPVVRPGHVLVETAASAVSTGTERMLVEFGRAGWIQKARSQPDKVRQVLRKVRTDGLMPTVRAVRDKLNKPVPLGYCNAGRVLEVAEDVRSVSPGDLVVSNGPHAEVVCVPENLCAPIPRPLREEVGAGPELFEQACFTAIAAVALQGVRLARPTLGEVFAVIGLGLVGQLTVQILRANGCRVVGLDLDPRRVEMAEELGAHGLPASDGADVAGRARQWAGGRGLDGALLTAATRSSEPVRQAARMCRKRGRLVLVGVSGLDLERDDLYEKELSLQVSCSYGPGRHDPDYEQKGRDYPFGLVRWTARRNFRAVLQLMAEGKLDVTPLVKRRVPLGQAPAFYKELAEGVAGLGTVLTYPDSSGSKQRKIRVRATAGGVPQGRPVVGVIGAGSFATGTILPILKSCDVQRCIIASPGGTSAVEAARRFGFATATSRCEEVFEDDAVNTVFILSRHDSHADYVCRALQRRCNVFVEKPLAITCGQLAEVCAARRAAGERGPLLHVGFNRRFAPHVVKVKQLLDERPPPKTLSAMVNAGRLSRGHWLLDPAVGGGRIIGEACHFVDLLRFLVGAPVEEVSTTCAGTGGPDPSCTITLRFAEGSAGTVHYWTNGSRAFPKERLHAFAGGSVLVMDNFRRLKGYGWGNFRGERAWWGQDKGHQAEVKQFIRRVREGGTPLIPFEQLREVTRICLRAAGRVAGDEVPGEKTISLEKAS